MEFPLENFNVRLPAMAPDVADAFQYTLEWSRRNGSLFLPLTPDQREFGRGLAFCGNLSEVLAWMTSRQLELRLSSAFGRPDREGAVWLAGTSGRVVDRLRRAPHAYRVFSAEHGGAVLRWDPDALFWHVSS